MILGIQCSMSWEKKKKNKDKPFDLGFSCDAATVLDSTGGELPLRGSAAVTEGDLALSGSGRW